MCLSNLGVLIMYYPVWQYANRQDNWACEYSPHAFLWEAITHIFHNQGDKNTSQSLYDEEGRLLTNTGFFA